MDAASTGSRWTAQPSEGLYPAVGKVELWVTIYKRYNPVRRPTAYRYLVLSQLTYTSVLAKGLLNGEGLDIVCHTLHLFNMQSVIVNCA